MLTLALGPGTLRLYGKDLQVLSTADAAAFGEEPVQLLESGVAEFVLEGVPSGWRLREGGAVVSSRVSARAGTISAGNEAGLLTLVLEDEAGQAQARVGIELVTRKLGYRDDFRTMLEDLTRYATDLLLRLRTEITSPFVPDPQQEVRTQIQRFFFLRGLLESPRFQAALARVLAHPRTALVPEESTAPIARAPGRGSAGLRALASGQPRRGVPAPHPLAARVETVPVSVPRAHPVEIADTPENRFVRHALEGFLAVLRLPPPTSLAERRLQRELQQLRLPLERALTHPTLAGVGPLTRLPLESAVLQRRHGYRELLEAYLAAQRALQLRWDGGEAVYGGGRRDVAALYEYWCFFQVLRAVEQAFAVRFPAEALLTPGFSLRLQRGATLTCQVGNVHLAYNPTLPTWTRPVRPDITLLLGERAVHFDAKYRVHRDDTLTDDLLEMHAYRDALPGTHASIVLYPGTSAHWWQRDAGGLGAFPLLPGRPATELESFLATLAP